MSATVDCNEILDYFRTILDSKDIASPYIIPQQSTLKTYFIDDLNKLTHPSLEAVQIEVYCKMRELICTAKNTVKEVGSSYYKTLLKPSALR